MLPGASYGSFDGGNADSFSADDMMSVRHDPYASAWKARKSHKNNFGTTREVGIRTLPRTFPQSFDAHLYQNPNASSLALCNEDLFPSRHGSHAETTLSNQLQGLRLIRPKPTIISSQAPSIEDTKRRDHVQTWLLDQEYHKPLSRQPFQLSSSTHDGGYGFGLHSPTSVSASRMRRTSISFGSDKNATWPSKLYRQLGESRGFRATSVVSISSDEDGMRSSNPTPFSRKLAFVPLDDDFVYMSDRNRYQSVGATRDAPLEARTGHRRQISRSDWRQSAQTNVTNNENLVHRAKIRSKRRHTEHHGGQPKTSYLRTERPGSQSLDAQRGVRDNALQPPQTESSPIPLSNPLAQVDPDEIIDLLKRFNTTRTSLAPFVHPFADPTIHRPLMSYEDLADFYLNIVNTLPRPSKSSSPQRIGITLFWDCENIGGSQFLMFLPSIVQRIYDHFADLPHGVEFRSCYVALRECGSSRINCFAIHKIQQYLSAAGIYVEIIPESAGYEAADLSLYESIGHFIINTTTTEPAIPVVITGDSDFTRGILLLRAYSFPVLLVRPEHIQVNTDFLTSTPHQIIWGSNSIVADRWQHGVCVLAEAVLCLRASEAKRPHPKMTAVVTQKIHEILGWLRRARREPTDQVQWLEFTKRGKIGVNFWKDRRSGERHTM